MGMWDYYAGMAIRSVRRNRALTMLMIIAVGVGIGASMTLLTALRAMSADPIPAKSARLFSVRVDNWGPDAPNNALLSDLLSYADATALLRAGRGVRQSAMYPTQFSLTPGGGNADPFAATARAVGNDFFAMFDAPFAAGAAWTAADDRNRLDVTVIGARLAQRLFPAGDAVGRQIVLDNHSYRIVGVLKAWRFQPRVYDLTFRLYQETEDVFVPFTTAVQRQLPSLGGSYCDHAVGTAFMDQLRSECRWLQFWVELPDAGAAPAYGEFLRNYAAEQRAVGRFHWPPKVALLNVKETLQAAHIIPAEMRVSTVAAFGFLLVCLVNATGLMLAMLNRRAAEFSIRRAVGASRRQIFAQCLAEAAAVGVGGAALGLLLTVLGLFFERSVLREDYARLVQLSPDTVLMTVALALMAVAVAALYPAWNASRLQPTWQLKAE
jgi:putative ABC transport system permease protein